MRDKHIQLAKATAIQQQFDTFAGCELAPFVLSSDAGFATAQTGLFSKVT
jgi:hypothetical protein